MPLFLYIVSARRVHSDFLKTEIRIRTMPAKIMVDCVSHFLCGKVALILIKFLVGVINIVRVLPYVLDEVGQRLDEPTAFHIRPISTVRIFIRLVVVVAGLVGITENVDVLDTEVLKDGVEIKFLWCGEWFKCFHITKIRKGYDLMEGVAHSGLPLYPT